MTFPDIGTLAFIAFSGVTLGGAALLAFTKNIIYAVFLLFIVLFGVAGLYVFYGAEFLAVSQVIVYVGGILVILIFGVMLTHKLRDLKPRTEIVNLLPGLFVAGGLFAAFFLMVDQIDFANHSMPTEGVQMDLGPVEDSDVERIGAATLTRYLLPFELISVLLLAVLIGAAYLSRKAKGKEARA